MQAITDSTPVTIAGEDFETPDGTCMRDFIEVRDVAHAVVGFAQHHTAGIFNIGSGVSVSLAGVVSAFERVTGKGVQRIVTAQRSGDPAYVGADIRKISEQGFVPQYALDDMVKSSL